MADSDPTSAPPTITPPSPAKPTTQPASEPKQRMSIGDRLRHVYEMLSSVQFGLAGIAMVLVALLIMGWGAWHFARGLMPGGTPAEQTKIAPGTPDAPPADQANNGADVDTPAPARQIQVVVTGMPEVPPWQAPRAVSCASDTVMVRGDGKWSLEMGANTWVTWGVTCDGQVFRDKRDMKPVPGACFVPDHLPDAGAWSEEYEQTPACPWRKVLITNPGGADHSGRPSDIASIGQGTFPQDTEAHLMQIAPIVMTNEAAIAAHHPPQ